MATLPALELWLSQVFSFAVEFNYPVAHPGRSPVALPLETVLKIALTEPDPIQVSRAPFVGCPLVLILPQVIA